MERVSNLTVQRTFGGIRETHFLMRDTGLRKYGGAWSVLSFVGRMWQTITVVFPYPCP